MERDFRAELAEREAKHFKKKLGDGAAGPEDADPARLAAPADDDDDGPKFVPRDLDADDATTATATTATATTTKTTPPRSWRSWNG